MYILYFIYRNEIKKNIHDPTNRIRFVVVIIVNYIIIIHTRHFYDFLIDYHCADRIRHIGWCMIHGQICRIRQDVYEFFQSLPGNIARGLSTDRACEVGAMTEGNISR